TSGSSRNPSFVRALESAAHRGAAVAEGAKAGPVIQAKDNVAYVQISTPLEYTKASDKTPAIRKAIDHAAGVKTYLSGGPAIDHDTTPISNRDLGKGERIALPIALLVLAFMFGTLVGIA